ncbi:MAG TPA: GNAT family N-acetyltransferase [Candidatus Binataceae bacterium]|nr:GNAT family N-acetyltransferase [Candidatus Binataceae bacterium]
MKTWPHDQYPSPNDSGHLVLRPLSQGQAIWQNMLRTFPGATLYHSEAWIALLRRAYRLSMWLATLVRDGRVVAGGVFARSHNPFARRFVSFPFSDSCPPLALSGEAARDLLEALVTQMAPGTTYEIRGIEAGAPWKAADCFVNWRLDLERPPATIERGLASNFRRNLRRAQRDTKVEHGTEIALLKRFYAIQLDSRRRFGLPPQPWRFFQLAHELFAPKDLDIWLASEGGKDVAAAIFVRDGDTVHFKWGARRPDPRSNANHLLLWSAIEKFASRARVLDLGRTDFRNTGLMRFKRELGAVATPLPYSFFPLAPRQVSPEVLTGAYKVLAGVWSRLPIFATRLLGWAACRILA